EQQLGCMFLAQTAEAEPWPDGLVVTDPSVLFPYLMATTFDGTVEIVAEDTVNYLLFRNGSVERAFLAAGHHGTVVDRVAKLFAREGRNGAKLRRWQVQSPLPAQAPPALVQAYRDLATGLVQRLIAPGHEAPPHIPPPPPPNPLPPH